MEGKDLKDIIAFAIEREEEAINFYTGLSGHFRFAPRKELLEELADMERGHIVVLRNMEKKGFPAGAVKSTADLSISQYLVKPEKPADQLEYHDILVLAMKREEASLKLYRDLASRVSGTPQAAVFLRIAEEEADHKLKFETIYDQDILKEN